MWAVAGALDGTSIFEGEQQDASNVLNILRESTFQMENRISEEVARKKAVRFYLSLHVNFHLNTDEKFLTNPPTILNTNAMEVYNSSEIRNALRSICGNFVSAIEFFQQRGSGWSLNKLLALDIHILEFNLLRATSYIPLPQGVHNRKAVINIQNKDEKCFYGLLLLVYMEILMKQIMSVYLTMHNTNT